MRVDGLLVVNNIYLTLNAAVAGSGLALVIEDIAAPHVESGRLVRVLDAWCPPFASYHLYYPDRLHPTSAFRALLDELRDVTRLTEKG